VITKDGGHLVPGGDEIVAVAAGDVHNRNRVTSAGQKTGDAM
jgi:hypothetical protein